MTEHQLPLIERLAQIREQAGYDPLPDPRVIEGPPLAPPPDENPDEDEDFPDEVVQAPSRPSPLHQLGKAETLPPGRIEPLPPLFPAPEMAVVQAPGGTIASYLDHQVTLTEKESLAVKRVVLAAIVREANDELKKVKSLLPKRRRVSKAEPKADGIAPSATPPRKRGRSRKS